LLKGGGDAYWKRRAAKAAERREKNGSLYDPKAIQDVKRGIRQWQDAILGPWVSRSPESKEDYQTA